MAAIHATSYVKDEQGATFIAASQRPDGTWRKSRRVKDGYIPQDEIPLYESKGKQFIKNKPLYPVGYTPDVPKAPKSKTSQAMLSPIPGLVVDNSTAKANKKKKKKKQNPTNDSVDGNVNESPSPPISTTTSTATSPASSTDPVKRVKNLRKRLREIETIQEKINSGELKNPEKDQIDKVSRKSQLESEIQELIQMMNSA